MKANQANATAAANAVNGNQVVNKEAAKGKQTIPVVIPVKLEPEKKEPVQPSTEIQKKILSIDELTERAERLNLQRLKYEEIKEKRKQLQTFAISHDDKNAQLTIIDAKGARITTNSPLSIGQVINIWGAELDSHLERVENEMRSILEVF